MAQISVDVTFLDEPDPLADSKVRMSVLRRTFFEDLDRSNKVNLNKIDNLTFGEPASSQEACEKPLEKELRAPSENSSASEFHTDRQVGCEAKVITPEFNSCGHDILDTEDIFSAWRSPISTVNQAGDHVTSLRPKSKLCGYFKLTVAMLTNIVAGSLSGIIFKRVFRSIASTAMSGILVTQSLCIMGYATVSWGALVRDVYRLVIRGPEVEYNQGVKNRFSLAWGRLIFTLSQSAPRRASFWAGLIAGIFLL
ncbi:unnamed protein product [Phytomonas sp. EM1]|nr:unnamed protein product [Phytomonas sp. EM1]|eukprot:CCW61560.1 unnamed protein product [Phytomonas sp. isolate EM1]